MTRSRFASRRNEIAEWKAYSRREKSRVISLGGPRLRFMDSRPVHILFLCSQNRLRSPTAERVFATAAGVEAASAGLSPDAEQPVTPEIIAWADLIFVMEKAHRNRLQKKFKAHLSGKRVVCLDIPDEYDYMDPKLVLLLKAKVSPYLPR